MYHIANYYVKGEKTERQWNLEGYTVKKGEVGAVRWTNWYCQHQAIYYTAPQVRKMTEKQHEKWKEQDRLRRNEMARKSYKKRRDKWLKIKRLMES